MNDIVYKERERQRERERGREKRQTTLCCNVRAQGMGNSTKI